MANITFGSNEIVNGTTGNDSMIGNEPTGNTNDIIYGHQGDDTITFTDSVRDSTMYGGQGNDVIYGFSDSSPGGRNIIYGNFGNDTILSSFDTGDTIYGGQGNDTINSFELNTGAIYGNLGNDVIYGLRNNQVNYYGGQGNDTVFDDGIESFTGDVIYGNQGNDLLIGFGGIGDTHEYGGQGNDTLVFTGTDDGPTTNDTMTGNLGDDLFIATNDAGGFGGNPISADEIVTVTDFLSGTDQLAFTTRTGIPLVQLAGIGDNVAQALTAANGVYAGQPGSEYVFVYGGTGAGFLFYNGDANERVAVAGMAIEGHTSPIAATDITTIPNNVPIA
jgi:Ca2+-binding RTX toxin-like protein